MQDLITFDLIFDNLILNWYLLTLGGETFDETKNKLMASLAQ